MRNTIVSSVCMAWALVFAASCNKVEEIIPFEEGNGNAVITAVANQIGAGTKVEMAYFYEALWQTGDQIYVKQGTTTDTFTLVSGEGTTKGTFEGTKSMTGEIEAFYPESVGKTMKWPEIQTDDQTVPMYAHQDLTGEEGETVDFSSLGAMLQIVFNSTVENITLKSIELKDGKKNLSGTFTVDENGCAVISSTDGKGVTLDLGDGKSLGKGTNFFYLAIPAGKYDDLTISFYTDDRRVCTMHSSTFPEVVSNTVCRLVLTGTKFMARQLSLPGKFTIEKTGRVVKFAKGNLYWDGDSYEFEDSQLDYPEAFDPEHVGHFFWCQDAAEARAASFDSSSSREHDVLFTNDTEGTPNLDFTVSRVTGEFRTLSQIEWTSLLDSHEHNNVSIDGLTGIAIAPDGYEGRLAKQYDAASWAAAQAAGVVFIPSASYRKEKVVDDEVNGKYWTSAPWTSARGQAVIWYADNCSTMDVWREYGCAIRLVEDMLYVKSVSLDKTVLTLYASQNVQLTATVLPENAPDKSVVWTSDDTDVVTVDKDGKVIAVSPGTATITATTVDRRRTASCTVTVEPLVSGVFSVNESGKTVRFAQGNLYWDGISFEFEDSQPDCPVEWSAIHVGHFFWSMDAAVARARTYNSFGSGEHDVLFTNDAEETPNPDFTVGGVTGEFRALSQLEWAYLLDKHTQKHIKVGAKTGIALLPDGYEGGLADQYETDAWAAVEASGVVFLPSASYRTDEGVKTDAEGNGKYWTSAPYHSYSAQIAIWYDSIKYCSCSDLSRSHACSLRLVKDVKN